MTYDYWTFLKVLLDVKPGFACRGQHHHPEWWFTVSKRFKESQVGGVLVVLHEHDYELSSSLLHRGSFLRFQQVVKNSEFNFLRRRKRNYEKFMETIFLWPIFFRENLKWTPQINLVRCICGHYFSWVIKKVSGHLDIKWEKCSIVNQVTSWVSADCRFPNLTNFTYFTL